MDFNDTPQARWKRVCPPLFRENDMARLETMIGTEKFNKILAWDRTSPTAIGLIGPTGSGKTRVMFELIRKFIFEDDRKGVVQINASSMGDELAASYAEGADAAEEWIMKLIRASILFIDDLGKGKMTERCESALYRVIDTRMQYQRQLFFTSNCTGDDMLRILSSDRAEPLIRRLREMCEIIVIP